MPVIPTVLLVLWSVLSVGSALPDQGKWDFLMTQVCSTRRMHWWNPLKPSPVLLRPQEQPTFALPKSLLAGSKIFVQSEWVGCNCELGECA